MRTPTLRRAVTAAVLIALGLTACGGDGDQPDLPPEAEAGRDLVRSNGCASCHGANGQGGVGPAFTGLYGSEVTLDDGTTVVADAAYLRESITDPRAKIVDGYGLPMPTTELDDAEIESIITYIAALAEG